jgi:endonuclease/exonuclease/phosphatase family metal-dependent hydrolase
MMFPRMLMPLLTLVLAASANAINLGTYNIRYDNSGDPKDGNAWPQRAPIIAQMLRFHEFDIVGTQEGLAHQIKDLSALLPEHSYTGCGRDDGKEAGEFIAIFYRKDHFKVKDSGQFWLSETPEKPSKGWDAALPRMCAWAKFEETATRKTFFFFSTHFDHRGVEARKQSALLLVHMIEKIAGSQPAVLCGDFNVDQTSESYKVLHDTDQYLRDSYEVAPIRLAPNGTPNKFDPNVLTEQRIDHVFVTRQFNVSRYGILTDSYRIPKPEGSAESTSGNFPSEVKLKDYQARLPSDHFPVLIEATF